MELSVLFPISLLLIFIPYILRILKFTLTATKFSWNILMFFYSSPYSGMHKNGDIATSRLPWFYNSAETYFRIDKILSKIRKSPYLHRGLAYKKIVSLHNYKINYKRTMLNDFIIHGVPPICILFFLQVFIFGIFAKENLLNSLICVFLLTLIEILVSVIFILCLYYAYTKDNNFSRKDEAISDEIFAYLVDVVPEVRTPEIDQYYNDIINNQKIIHYPQKYYKYKKYCKIYNKYKKDLRKVSEKYNTNDKYSFLYVNMTPPIVGEDYWIPEKHLKIGETAPHASKGARFIEWCKLWLIPIILFIVAIFMFFCIIVKYYPNILNDIISNIY